MVKFVEVEGWLNREFVKVVGGVTTTNSVSGSVLGLKQGKDF